MSSLRVLSCVPQQKYTFFDKIKWAEEQYEEHKPDVIVLPQEYHGGIQTEFFAEEMAAVRRPKNEKLSYDPKEIIEPYTDLSRRCKVGITVGAVVDDPILGQRRERIFVFDPTKGLTGYVDKMFLPGYDHVDAKGRVRITPENNFDNRAKAFELCGARVGVLFCWEVYSSHLWYHIAKAQPDFVVSMVKFGVNGWPAKGKDGEKMYSVITGKETTTGEKGSTFEGFGFGNDGGWIERLRMASKWDLAAPIVCSTNSWRLPRKVGAIMGQILPWEEKEITTESGSKWPRDAKKDSLWISEGKGLLLEDNVQVDQVDYMYWRYIRAHKTELFEHTGNWPSSEARAFTMNWKIKRMERQFAGLPKLMAESSLPDKGPEVKPRKQIEVPAGQGLLANKKR